MHHHCRRERCRQEHLRWDSESRSGADAHARLRPRTCPVASQSAAYENGKLLVRIATSKSAIERCISSASIKVDRGDVGRKSRIKAWMTYFAWSAVRLRRRPISAHFVIAKPGRFVPMILIMSFSSSVRGRDAWLFPWDMLTSTCRDLLLKCVAFR